MLVRELLTKNVACATVETDLDAAIHLLAEHRVTALPVVDGRRRVVGILSEADVLRLHLVEDPRAHLRRHSPLDGSAWPRTVGEVMTPDPVVARPGDDVAEVAQLLADTGWKSLPVAGEGRRLVGMVSRSDVIRALSTDDATIRRRVERGLVDFALGSWQVSVSSGAVTLRGDAPQRLARAAADLVATTPGVRSVVVVESGAPVRAT